MPLRSGALGDPTSPSAPSSPPVPSTGPSAPPASTAAAQPVKKAGRGAASQERRSGSEDPPESDSSSHGKKARLYPPDHGHIDNDMRSADERKAEVRDAARPSSTPAASRAPANASVATSSSSSSSPVPSLSSASSPAAAPAQMSDIAPVWASPKRLDEAKVDFRVLTDLVVDLTVDMRACTAPSVMSRMYREDAGSKCSAAAALLGDSKEAGFRVVPPVLPRALLVADAATRAQWSEPQQAWYKQLEEHARDHGDCIRDSRSTPERLSAALLTVFTFVNPEQVIKLWPRPETRTSTWKDLLILPTAILQDRTRDFHHAMPKGAPSVTVPEHSYSLRLCCATMEVSFVVACCIANYALLAREEKETAQRLRAILAGDGKPTAPAANAETSVSEGDSSDSDGEWRTQRPHSEAARQRRRAAARRKQLTAFATKELSGERFKADSANPLLQLATRVTVRSWQHHFLECFVSNWQSVGCPSIFDQADAAFVRATTAVPALRDAHTARWHLRQQVGGTLVSLFVREDLVPHLPSINTVLRQHPELSDAALKVVCDVYPCRARGRGERGRFAYRERSRRCLTPEEAPVTDRQVSAVPSSSSQVPRTSAPPSWAAVLSASRPVAVPAARRPAPSAPLDQRPRKDQRREPSSTPSPSSTPAIAAQVASSVSSGPREARMAAMEARFNRLESRMEQLLDLPRQLRSLEHKLDRLSPSKASSAPSAPVLRSPARVASADAEALTTRVGEITSEMDEQGRLMRRLLGLLEAFMPEAVEAMLSPRECGEGMSDADRS